MGNLADFSHLAEKNNDADSGSNPWSGCGCIALIIVFLIGGFLGWLNRN
jgi:hypothetical protein